MIYVFTTPIERNVVQCSKNNKVKRQHLILKIKKP